MIDLHRIWVKNKAVLTTLSVVLASVLMLYTVNSPAIVGAAATTRLLPIYSVERTDKVVAISFDAAWGNEDTQTLIDILGAHNVHATFFLVGDWVVRYPESVAAIAEAGHEVMNHSSHHDHYSKLREDQVIADVKACNDKVEAITGVAPTLIRCPYGEYDDHVIRAISSIGMKAIQWSVDSLDWKGISAAEITERVLSRVEPGSIVLFHNAAEHTPEALPGILEALQHDGYTIVPISELLLNGDYTIDHTGKQCAA